MIKAESLESIKVSIVFRDKHAYIMTGLLSYLPGLQQGSFQLCNQVLSLLACSLPVPSQLKANALAENSFFSMSNLMKLQESDVLSKPACENELKTLRHKPSTLLLL